MTEIRCGTIWHWLMPTISYRLRFSVESIRRILIWMILHRRPARWHIGTEPVWMNSLN